MSNDKGFVSIDWLIKILVGIAAFFLVGIFITVQKTASDVNELKSTIKIMQYRYDDLNNRVKLLEVIKK